MKKLLTSALLGSLLIAGCATAPAEPPVVVSKPVEAKVEVSTSCVSAIPQPDSDFLSDAILLTGSGSQVADNLWADHLERRDYIAKLVAALSGCVMSSANAQAAGQTSQ